MRFIQKQIAVLMLVAIMIGVGWYGSCTRITPAHAGDEYDPFHTMLALNMAIVSVHRIVNTKDRIILTQEYDSIINNLKIGDIEADFSMLSLYSELMDVISEKRLREDQAARFQALYKSREHRQFVSALSGIRAYGGNIMSMLGSLAVSCVSQYFGYQDAKAQLAEELDDKEWQLQEQDIRDCNDMQKVLLQSSWSLLRQYSLPDAYRITQIDLDAYNKALNTYAASKRKNMLRQLEDKFSVYPPYWIYRAAAARESADEADMRHCYDKFDEVWRSVMRQDPFKVESLKFRIGELAAKGTSSDTLQMRACLKEMRDYTPRNDWQNNLFAGVAYFVIGDKDDAIDCVECNVDFGYEMEISSRILDQMKRGNLDISSLSPELAALVSSFDNGSSDTLASAENGNPYAQYAVGRNYYFGEEGVAQDYIQAADWFRKAAEHGHSDAQFYLGQAYYNGEGVTKDYRQAIHWFRKAAEQRHAGAQYSLGNAYDTGRGVTQDAAQAVGWWRQAADQGHDGAQYSLGNAYFTGNGVTRDYDHAVELWRKAADQGHARAQYNLGIAYKYGNGVEKDVEEASRWLKMAAGQGFEDAKKEMKGL